MHEAITAQLRLHSNKSYLLVSLVWVVRQGQRSLCQWDLGRRCPHSHHPLPGPTQKLTQMYNHNSQGGTYSHYLDSH